MYFGQLQSKLIDIARYRIRSGEFTERGLARRCGISQPHLHNALKRIRTLSPEASDKLLEGLGLRVPDLLWNAGADLAGSITPVPLMRHRIGPGTDADLELFRGFVPFENAVLAGIQQPVVARLAADLVLPAPLAPQDLVLLDQNPEGRSAPSGKSIWVVREPGGLRVRYLRWRGSALYIADESNLQQPDDWRLLAPPRTSLLNLVCARVVWTSREIKDPLL